MKGNSLSTHQGPRAGRAIILVLAFLLIAAAGLVYVKWWPYFHKMLTAADTNAIGSSILGEPAAQSGPPSWSKAAQYAEAYFKSVWKAALLGILLGSLLQVLIPSNWLLKLFGKSNFGSVLSGGIASLPGMMCSCCAAPIAVGMRRKQASVGAALAFWIGNPLLNPATLVFMAFVLPWKFTVLRIVLGLLLTFGVGYAANRMMRGRQSEELPSAMTASAALAAQPADTSPFWSKWARQLGTMLLQVIPAYIVAVLALGAMQTWLFPISFGSGAAILLLFAVAGTLFVIPTAAEIPIIQSFLAAGIAAGPVTALLVTLPAISLPSLLMVWRSFPRRIMLLVVLSVIGTGIVSGFVGALWM